MARRLRIGLLGGSFNPAHAGHLHISREAIKRLGLHAVWWLVSPRNPLKAVSELADYALRFTRAQQVAKPEPRIRVRDLEARAGLYYTVDTLRYLRARHPRVHFIWLMGADNLAQFHRWRGWQTIAQRTPIAVLDRAPFLQRALRGVFARRYASRRVSAALLRRQAMAKTPRWSYLAIPRHPLSASQLRKTLGSDAFLRQNIP